MNITKLVNALNKEAEFFTSIVTSASCQIIDDVGENKIIIIIETDAFIHRGEAPYEKFLNSKEDEEKVAGFIFHAFVKRSLELYLMNMIKESGESEEE